MWKKFDINFGECGEKIPLNCMCVCKNEAAFRVVVFISFSLKKLLSLLFLVMLVKVFGLIISSLS